MTCGCKSHIILHFPELHHFHKHRQTRSLILLGIDSGHYIIDDIKYDEKKGFRELKKKKVKIHFLSRCKRCYSVSQAMKEMNECVRRLDIRVEKKRLLYVQYILAVATLVVSTGWAASIKVLVSSKQPPQEKVSALLKGILSLFLL